MDACSDSFTIPIRLHKFEFPQVPAVDLLDEFRSCFARQEPEKPQDKPSIVETLRTSPYTQEFPQAHPIKETKSAAEKAQSKIARLKRRLNMQTTTKTKSKKSKSSLKTAALHILGNSNNDQPTRKEIIAEDFNIEKWKQELLELHKVSPREEATRRKQEEHEISFPYDPSQQHHQQQFSKSLEISVSTPTLQQKNTEQRQHLSKDDTKRIELFKWLEKQKSKTTLSPNPITEISKELESKIHSKLYQHLGQNLFTDETTSTLAEPHTTENLFGDGSTGKAPKFHQTAAENQQDFLHLTDRVIVDAELIKAQAKKQEQSGHLEEAIQVYKNGIQQLISPELAEKQDQSRQYKTGFNYARDVHHQAARIQRNYQLHYIRRNQAAVHLQYILRRLKVRLRIHYRLYDRVKAAKSIQQGYRHYLAILNRMALKIQCRIRGNKGRQRAIELLKFYAARRIQKRVRGILGRKHFVLKKKQLFLHRGQARLLQRQFRLYRQRKAANRIQTMYQEYRIRYAKWYDKLCGRFGRGWQQRVWMKFYRASLISKEELRREKEKAFSATETKIGLELYDQFLSTAEGRHLITRHINLQKAATERKARKRKESNWTKEEILRDEALEVFQMYDVDESGEIDHEELGLVFQELGIALTKQELGKVVAALDDDQNGSIDVEEFCDWYCNPNALSSNATAVEKAKLKMLQLKLLGSKLFDRFTNESLRSHALRHLKYKQTILLQEESVAQFRRLNRNNVPKFECTYCKRGFLMYREFFTHESKTCDKLTKLQAKQTRRHRRSGVTMDPTLVEKQRAAGERQAIDQAEVEAMDELDVWLSTRDGKKALQLEIERLQKHEDKTTKTESIDKTRELFDTFDVDGSGTIDSGEFVALVKDFGLALSRNEVLKILETLDGDKSGEIEYIEFKQWFDENAKQLASSRQLKSTLLKTKNMWAKVSGSNRKDRALRYWGARMRLIAKINTINWYRLKFPPEFHCLICDAVFETKDEMDRHAQNSATIHQEMETQLREKIKRLGFVNEVTELPELEYIKLLNEYLPTKHSQMLYPLTADLLTKEQEPKAEQEQQKLQIRLTFAQEKAHEFLLTKKGQQQILVEMQRLVQLQQKHQSNTLLFMFEMFDIDASGTIDEFELELLLRHLSFPSDLKTRTTLVEQLGVYEEVEKDNEKAFRMKQIHYEKFERWYEYQQKQKQSTKVKFQMAKLHFQGNLNKNNPMQRYAESVVLSRHVQEILQHQQDQSMEIETVQATQKHQLEQKLEHLDEDEDQLLQVLDQVEVYIKTANGKKQLKQLTQYYKQQAQAREKASKNMTKEARELKEAELLFDSFDIDGSGEINNVEFRLLLKEIGWKLKEDEFLKILSSVDTDCSGEINKEEFLGWLKTLQQEKQQADEQQKQNKNNFITQLQNVKNMTSRFFRMSSNAQELAKRQLIKEFLQRQLQSPAPAPKG